MGVSLVGEQRRRSLRLNPSALSVIGTAQTCTGTTYYVRTDGLNSHTGLTNTAGGAWQTIGKGLTSAAAGDCVRVQAGTYLEVAAASANGTSGNYLTVVADGVVSACGMTFSAKSYIRIIGLSFDTTLGGCSNAGGTIVDMTGTNTGLEMWNGAAGNNATGHGTGMFSVGPRCTTCIFLGNSFHDVGGTNADVALGLAGNDLFVGYNNFTGICYIGIGPTGARGRYLNNNFSGMIQCGGSHPDFFYIDGSQQATGFSNNLIESTFGIGTNTANNNKFHHMQNQDAEDWVDNIYRLNVGTQIGSGAYSIYTSSTGSNLRTRWYNNSWVSLNRANSGTGVSCGSGNAIAAGTTVTAYFYNEIAYECWGTGVTSNIDGIWSFAGGSGTLTIFKDYNLGFDPDGAVSFNSNWTNQAHEQTNVDPKLTNVAGNDFTLQSSSGARGVGGPLTTAVGAGTTSTSLTVATNTGSFFTGDNTANLTQYSGKLTSADVLTVGTCTATVSSVSGDTITLATPCSWANADPVYFGASTTIDMGAYQYKAGGYTLSATKLCSGSTCTITPNDNTLVRFVVCYEAGVPYKVVNASPYTCTAPLGTFEARVYPKYASQTQWVVAQ
jgi:hypothetical protein